MNALKDKSYAFAIRIVKLSKYLNETYHIYKLSEQILKSGTAIGALTREAEYAQSKADFVNKISIGLKEANETEYWLNLLKDTGYLEEKLFQSLETDVKELIKISISTINTTKKGISKK
jgi:four helix bundle protein